MPGDTRDLTFALDGIVVERSVERRLDVDAARWTPGASTLQRLLRGEEVPARAVDDHGAHVSVTFSVLGGRFEGFALLRCGAIEVLVAPLGDHEVAGLAEAGHPVHAHPARSVDDYLAGADHELVVRLRNVLVRPMPERR